MLCSYRIHAVHAVQTKDDEDPDLEHGKAMDDMWALDLNKYTVSCPHDTVFESIAVICAYVYVALLAQYIM